MTIQSVIARFFLITLLCLSSAWQSAVYAADTVETVDINMATAVEIAEGLKGIGLKRAEAIVEYRGLHGKFQSLESLLEVKGVGEKTLEKNKDVITL